MENDDKINEKELGLKPSFSIIIGVGWLIFLIMWFAFYASDYAWEKNVAIILLSIVIMFLLLGGMWACYGFRKIPSEEKKMFNTSGFKWRIILSIVLPFIAIILLIIWFWFYAQPYSVWQNIAVILVTLLIIGGILGSLWARWGIKYGHKFNKKCEKEE